MASAHPGVKFLRVGPTKRWVVRWRDPADGKPQQRDCLPLGLSNADLRRRWAVAKAAELQKTRAVLALGPGAAQRVQVAASQADYLAGFSNPRTLVSKRPHLDDLAEHLGAAGVQAVQDIEPRHLAAWAHHVRRPANPHSVGTRNLVLLVAGAWLRWARELGQLPRVTPEHIKAALRRQKAPTEPIEILRPAQVRDVLRACLAHDEHEPVKIAPLALLLLGSGMRYSEGAELLWSEVDTEARAVRLPSARVKTKAARVVGLDVSPVVLELLGAIRLRGRGSGRVFSVGRKQAEAARERTMAKYGAPTWTWQQLRRTCGSTLVCAGLLGEGSPFLAAKRLGHGLAIAERHYLNALHGLPRDATTIEQALGIDGEAKAIVRAVAGVTASAARQAN